MLEREVWLQADRNLRTLIEVDAGTHRAVGRNVVAIKAKVALLPSTLIRRARRHRASPGIVIHCVGIITVDTTGQRMKVDRRIPILRSTILNSALPIVSIATTRL